MLCLSAATNDKFAAIEDMVGGERERGEKKKISMIIRYCVLCRTDKLKILHLWEANAQNSQNPGFNGLTPISLPYFRAQRMAVAKTHQALVGTALNARNFTVIAGGGEWPSEGPMAKLLEKVGLARDQVFLALSLLVEELGDECKARLESGGMGQDSLLSFLMGKDGEVSPAKMAGVLGGCLRPAVYPDAASHNPNLLCPGVVCGKGPQRVLLALFLPGR